MTKENTLDKVDLKITRTNAIEKNMDPDGKQWGISTVWDNTLYVVGTVKDKDSPVKPVENYNGIPSYKVPLMGRFTTLTKAQEAMVEYLNRAWDAHANKGT